MHFYGTCSRTAGKAQYKFGMALMLRLRQDASWFVVVWPVIQSGFRLSPYRGGVGLA
jgi:hypothetical protein